MYIPRETIDLIRERSDIVEIIKKFVPTLKKKGKNYIGLCPFHKEKTPSFTVSHEKQIFHCFGCQTGGNVYTFISKIERLDFPGSVSFLAGMAGIEIKYEETQKNSFINEGYRINRFAQSFFHEYLKSRDGKPGRDYLASRGIKNEIIDMFNLGYSPESWDALTGSLKKKSIDLALCERLGLISVSDKNKGHHYDRFRNRVIFPIIDNNGRTIGFGGRRIHDNSSEAMPKYVNSPESEIYKKREVLYGFNLAHKYIKEMNRAIIVEGYLDVIACHQAGEALRNTVAPLGTAFTESQARIIERCCSEAVVLFDSDSAGMEAALKSIRTFSNLNVSIRIAMLPEGDPFDYLSRRSVREFMTIIDSAVKPVDFEIDWILKLNNNNNDKINTMMKIFSVINKIETESEKNINIYVGKISTMLKLDQNSVRKDYNNYIKKGYIKSGRIDDAAGINIMKPITRTYRDLVKLICNYPELIERATIDFSPHDIPDEVTRNIFIKISDLYYSNQNFSIDKMFDIFEDGLEMEFLNRSLIEGYKLEKPEKAYNEIYIKIKITEIDQKISKYADLIQNSSSSDSNYLTEIEILRREKEKLSNFVYNQ